MNEIEKLDQLIDMLGASISDVSSCEEDLENLDADFLRKYPDSNNPDISSEWKKMFANINLDVLYFRRRSYVKTVFSSMEGILFAMKRILLNHSKYLSAQEINKLQEYEIIGQSGNKSQKVIFLRKVFSFIEGFLNSIKRILLIHIRYLSAQDINKLQKYEFTGQSGDKSKKIIFLSIEDNVKFVIRTYEKVRTKGFSTDFGCNEWEVFKKSVTIRNRITHPKHSEDLFISEDEMKSVKQAYDWFHKVFNDLQNNETIE